jgi:porin
MKNNILPLVVLLTSIPLAAPASDLISPDEKQHKAGYANNAKIGGPASVGAQLEEDDEVKEPAFVFPAADEFFKPWFDWKKKLHTEQHFQLGTDYSLLFQDASASLPGGESTAASGVFRLFGKWDLVGRGTKNKGSLFMRVEHRHKLGTEIPPSKLGGIFDNPGIGYQGITGTLYTDVGAVLTDLNWQQALNDGSSGLVIGRFDPNDYMNIGGFANPWTTFSNAAILVDNSIALPDASWGIAGGSWLGEQWHILAGANDANGLHDDNSFFADGSEFFKFAELGWSPIRGERYFKKISLTYWHVDERVEKGIAQGDGFAFTANWTFDKKRMVFVRGGNGSGADANRLLDKNATIGLIERFFKSDLLGFAYNVGEPTGTATKNQQVSELFYRFQFSQGIALTPSVQLLIDPANNPNEDRIWVVGIRARITL